MNLLSRNGGLEEVTTATLDYLLGAGVLDAAEGMKTDIEGAENDALLGTQALLATRHPVVFLVTPGPEVRGQCPSFRFGLGYSIRPIESQQVDSADEFPVVPS